MSLNPSLNRSECARRTHGIHGICRTPRCSLCSSQQLWMPWLGLERQVIAICFTLFKYIKYDVCMKQQISDVFFFSVKTRSNSFRIRAIGVLSCWLASNQSNPLIRQNDCRKQPQFQYTLWYIQCLSKAYQQIKCICLFTYFNQRHFHWFVDLAYTVFSDRMTHCPQKWVNLFWRLPKESESQLKRPSFKEIISNH